MSEPKYKLVPVIPTQAQVESWVFDNWKEPLSYDFRRRIYREMIAAAPSPPQDQDREWCMMAAEREKQNGDADCTAGKIEPTDPRDKALRVAREALEEYGQHDRCCVLLDPLEESVECSCGLGKTLRQIKEIMGEK